MPLPSPPPPDDRPVTWLLTQDDLDRLPQVSYTPPGDQHVTCRAIQAGEREAAEEQADALRAEVARLTGLLDDARDQRDEARAEVVRLGEQFYRADLSDGYLADAETYEPDPTLGAPPEVVALMRLDRIIGNERALSEKGTGRVRGVVLDALRAWHEQQRADPVAPVVELYRDDEEQARPGLAPDPTLDEALAGPVDDDPRRPHPDSWPDDAVLLRYRELRDLVALHLDRYADARTARAMRDGDVPLRLAEVLR